MKKLFLIIFICAIPLQLNADTIIFKNGRTIKAERVWEENGKVKCYRGGGVIGYPKEMVERIEVEDKKKGEKSYKSIIDTDTDLTQIVSDDPVEIVERLYKFKPKDDYETIEEFKSRLNAFIESRDAKKTYVFKSAKKPKTNYIADEGILEIIYTRGEISSSEKSLGSYIGSNVFGVKKRIARSIKKVLKLDFANLVKIQKTLHHPYTLRIRMPTHKARDIVKNIRLIYVCKPKPNEKIDPHYISWRKGPYVSVRTDRRNPTIDFPYEDTEDTFLLSVTLLELIVYDNSTGHTLAQFQF